MADASLVFTILGVDKASSVLGGIGSKITALGTAGLVAAGGGLAALAVAGVKGAAALETTTTAFTSLLGSSEAAQAQIKALQQFAATTPFSQKDVLGYAQQYYSLAGSIGMAKDQVQPFLTTVGNLAAVTGAGSEAIHNAVTAIGQIGSSGKVTLDNLNQISEAFPGFNGAAAIAAGTGKTTAEVMKEISAGSIDAKTGVAALLDGMRQFPGAAGAMDAQSKTLAGLWSTLTDTFQIAVTQAFTPLVPAIKSALLGAADLLSNVLVPAFSTAMSFLIGIGSRLAGFFGQLKAAFESGAFDGLTSKLGDIVASVRATGGQIVEALGPPLVSLFDAIRSAIPSVIDGFRTLASVFGPLLAQVGKLAGSAAVGALVVGFRALAASIPVLSSGFQGVAGWMADNATLVKSFAVGLGAVVVAIQIYKGVTATITAATKLWAAAQAALNVVMSLNPIAIVVLAIVGLVAAIVYAYTQSETFRNIVNGVFGAVRDFVVSSIGIVKDVIMSVWNWISDNWKLLLAILTGPIGAAVILILTYWDQIVGGFTAVKDWIFARVEDIAGFITGLPGRVGGAISGMWEGIKGGATAVKDWIYAKVEDIVGFWTGLPSRIASAAAGMFDGIYSAFKGAINSVIGAWNNLSLGFDGFTVHIPLAPDISVPGFHIGTPDIPMLAKGGIVTGPTLAVLGDNPSRKEAIIPLERAGQFGFGGGGGTINITLDARETEQLLTMSKLRKEIRAAKGRGANSVQLALGS